MKKQTPYSKRKEMSQTKKAVKFIFSIAAAMLVLSGCGSGDPPAGEEKSSTETTAAAAEQTTAEANEEREENNMKKLQIEVNGHVLNATLADNTSAEALAELLSEGPLTLNMSDYGSFEKVGPLPQSLPRNDEHITTEPGDIILYLGNRITIYYDVNTWDFTRLGRIDGITQAELKEILGSGDVTVTLSLGN